MRHGDSRTAQVDVGPTRDREPGRQRGQGMVEFALVIPIVMVLLMGLLEFSVAMSISLGVNRASQGAAWVAASAGNVIGADCLILRRVEKDIIIPGQPAKIVEVIIERTALAGNQSYGQQKWSRTGSTDCTLADGSVAPVPYTLITNGYPESQRCTVLSGCPLLTPARSTVDNIGVSVRYHHDWLTPLNGALDLIANGGSGNDAGWTFEQRNIFRIEPTL